VNFTFNLTVHKQANAFCQKSLYHCIVYNKIKGRTAFTLYCTNLKINWGQNVVKYTSNGYHNHAKNDKRKQPNPHSTMDIKKLICSTA